MQQLKQVLFTLVLGFGLIPMSLAQRPTPTTKTDLIRSAELKAQLQQQSLFKQYPIRNVGPVVQGGRVTDIAVNPRRIETYYVAYASGGLFKTTNNGTSFEPIFDGNEALGIGDIALAPSNPEIVWVGSGENNSSRSSYAGAGILKSIDGGKTWQNMGLRHSQHMGRIVVHPTNPDIVWVASLGALYSRNEERGLYKTVDGGKTWKKTLSINDSTGVIDIVIHPNDPKKLWASSWERSRKANNFKGNGMGSTIWRSEDGGETWTKSNTGFPDGAHVGRIGLSISMTNPDILYALLDNQEEVKTEARPNPNRNRSALTPAALGAMDKAQVMALADSVLTTYLRENRYPAKYTASSVKNSLEMGQFTVKDITDWLGNANDALFNTTVKGAEVYKSTDGGKSWKKTHQHGIDNLYFTYGYYFGEIRVSPDNADEIYILGVPLLKSFDGGVSFERIDDKVVDEYGNQVHVDHQAMWINPNNTHHLILGNDGGLYVSWDRGQHWTHYNNKPVGQFYMVNVDMETPYNIYGGMQDNGVYFGSSRSVPNRSPHWESISGGDGMHVLPDPRNHNLVISGSQFGNYARYDRSKNTRVNITPSSDIGRAKHRFNWNTPVVASPHNPDIIYMGSQFLMRSFNKGDTFEIISPDLTKNTPQGNVPYSTITTIAESSFNFGTLWVGTDDGNIHLSRNGGATWTNVSKGLPKDLWVAKLKTSPHQPATAYVALTGYRYDDFNAYIYKTEDYGKTWVSLKGNLPNEATNILLPDPVNPDVLYLGTDHGSYVTLDGGKQWHPLMGVPNVASYDMVVHPRDHELVIGTHGRSIFVLDVKPIQQLTPEKRNLPIVLWEPASMRRIPNWDTPPAPIFSKGPKGPEMSIQYFSATGGELKVSITHPQSGFSHTEQFNVEPGFGIYTWNIKGKDAKSKTPDALIFAPIGTYNLEMQVGDQKAQTKLTLNR